MGKLNTFPIKVLRKAISIALLTAGMAGAIGAAHAGQGGRDDRDNARAERAERREQFRSRDADAGRQPQGAQGQGADAGRHGRMTPDERRALRRQINEAGQDIYAPRR